MMTRNIRKIVSIICAVALLLSLCAVSFTGYSSAAITEEDDATVTTSWQTDSVLLDLTFDGTNDGGIAMSNASTRVIENGAFTFANGQGHYGTVWIAKDGTVNSGGATIPSTTNLNATDGAAAAANLFEMQSGTTYKVTFKYAFRKNTPANVSLQFMAAINPYLSSGHDRGKGLVDVSTTVDANSAKAGAPTGENTYGEYVEETYIFTTNANLNNKYLGFRAGSSNGAVGVRIDSIKIETGTMVTNVTMNDIDNEYVFDYTNADNQAQVTARQEAIAGNSNKALQHYSWYNWNEWLGNYGNATQQAFLTVDSYPGKPGFTPEGMKFTVGKGATLIEQETCPSAPPQAGDGQWANNAPIYDPDVGNNDGYGNAGGYLMTKDEASYVITVKYKVTQLTGSHLQLAIGALKQPTSGWVGIIPGSLVRITETSDEWQYLTVALDTAERTSYADKILTLTATTSGDTKWNTVIVDSITVEERRDTTNGIATMAYVSEGKTNYEMVSAGTITLPTPTTSDPDTGFAGWYTDPAFTADSKVDMNNYTAVEGVNTLYAKWVNTISDVVFDNCGVQTTSRLAPGLELPNPARPSSNLFFQGWYTDPGFTTKLTTVPDYDVTLYAKYNGTFLNFNNIGWVETSGSPELVVDPADPTNKVVKFTSGANSRPNFMIPAYDIAGSGAFELKTNTTYIVSYKMKLTDANGTAASSQLYRGDSSVYNANKTTRTGISGTGGSAGSTEWTTITSTFTIGETHYLERVKWSYQNHLFFTMYDGKNALSVYIDDFCVAEVLTEAPAGASTISFNTNAEELPDMYGFPGETVVLPEDPTLGGYEFVQWCTDKNLTKPYTATTFGTEDITLYAKWKSVPFLVDFSQYAEGQKSQRAHFEKDENGNDYLDWSVEYATDNTSDTGTPYRVFLNKNDNHYRVTEGTEYAITFKYKLLTGNVAIQAVTNGKLNGWDTPKTQGSKLSLNQLKEEWTEASFTFTADMDTASKNYLSFGIAGHGHIIVDDISVMASGDLANLYGSTIMYFSANGGDSVSPISGDPGEAIGTLPTPTRDGYAFNGWYTDEECTTPFTGKTWGEEDMTLYASWILGKFSESFEEFPASVVGTGLSGGYKLYNTTNFSDYDKANVQSGSVSIFRNGTQTGAKAFTLHRDAGLTLTEGKQYTLTFYVKPSNVTDAAGTISLIGMANSTTGINSPTSTNVITTVGDLKAGEWQKITYTFTADSEYIGISTTAGNDMYLDNFTVTLKGYTGSSTGDASVSPILITLMIVLAAGSLMFTGKKVFEK